MNVRRMMSTIFFFVTVVVVLAIAPTINTANNTAFATLNATTGAGNATNMIGMSVIMPFGAPLIILSMMVSFGLLAFGMKEGASIKDILSAVGVAVAQVIAVTLFSNVITYVSTLMAGTAGIALVIYGLIPIAIYLGIIASSGTYSAVQYFRNRKKGKKSGGAVMSY